ncbi:molybdopterin-guanine dinucleotide biosynthesis protein a [Leptolyngbya sp. Heron Island J]|nr:molybdopterin-guanine dinucleotide biosynthesis protein a [Leptolyngbya sp. Heron Island J]
MGQDKALLKLPTSSNGQSQTLLQHTCTIAQSCGLHTYVLSPWPERYLHLLPPTVVSLQETTAGAGPLVALAQGWSMVVQDAEQQNDYAPDWLLVLACDLPGLNRGTVQTWQQSLVDVSEVAIAALPHRHQRWEPLCGFYHRRCISSLNQAVENNIRSFQQWLATEPVMSLPVADSNILRNCNTPTQWQNFLDSAAIR